MQDYMVFLPHSHEDGGGNESTMWRFGDLVDLLMHFHSPVYMQTGLGEVLAQTFR